MSGIGDLSISKLWFEGIAIGDALISDIMVLGVFILVDFIVPTLTAPVMAFTGMRDPGRILDNAFLILKLILFKKVTVN